MQVAFDIDNYGFYGIYRTKREGERNIIKNKMKNKFPLAKNNYESIFDLTDENLIKDIEKLESFQIRDNTTNLLFLKIIKLFYLSFAKSKLLISKHSMNK